MPQYRKSQVVLLATVALVALWTPGSAVPKADFYSFGDQAGDESLPSYDEISSNEIYLKTPIIFYGQIYQSLFVNSNGFVSFLTEIPNFFNVQFPLEYPIIAPLYSDIDLSGIGKVWYRETSDPSERNRAKEDLRQYFGRASSFEPEGIFVVTWEAVGPFLQRSDKVNTFQLVIISDGRDSYVILQYADGGIQWLRGDGKNANIPDARAQAGLISGDGRQFILKGSGTDQVQHLDKWSNTGKAGVWMFRVGLMSVSENVEAPDLGRAALEADKSSSSCALGGTVCHSQARCIDYSPGFCCVCNDDLYGNGVNCLKRDEPLRVTGEVTGRINDQDLHDFDLHSYVLATEGRTYAAVSKVPSSIGYDMQPLLSLGAGIAWLFAKPQQGVKNGFMMTGGELNRTVDVEFPQTGHQITIQQHFKGLDVFNNIRVETQVTGSLPSIPLGTSIETGAYKEEFTRVKPGQLRSRASRNFRLKGQTLETPFTVETTIDFDECHYGPHDSTHDTLRLKVAENTFIQYDAPEKIVRYAMSAKVAPLQEEDPCMEGRSQCGPNSQCVVDGDSFRCVCDRGFEQVYDSIIEAAICLDMNECDTGRDECDFNAVCINTPGSYTCRCRPGYTGNGLTCNKDLSCNDVRCDPNARCEVRDGQPSCVCNPGFQGSGFLCTPDYTYTGSQREGTRCGGFICSPDADCEYEDVLNAFHCVCRDGFQGSGTSCTPDYYGSQNPYRPDHGSHHTEVHPVPEQPFQPQEIPPYQPEGGYEYQPHQPQQPDGGYEYQPHQPQQPDGGYEYQPHQPQQPDGGYEYQPHQPQQPDGGYEYQPHQPQQPDGGYEYQPHHPQQPDGGYEYQPQQPDGAYQPFKPEPPYQPYHPGGSYGHGQVEEEGSGAIEESNVVEPECFFQVCLCPSGYTYDQTNNKCDKEVHGGGAGFGGSVSTGLGGGKPRPYCGPVKCSCPEGYVYNAATQECDVDAEGVDEYEWPLPECFRGVCHCPTGYKYNPTHRRCDIHRVPGFVYDTKGGRFVSCNEINHCHVHAQCVYDGIQGLYECQCNAGFQGDGHTCVQTDVGCDQVNICHIHADCVYDDTALRSVCVCRAGYRGDGKVCTPLDECSSVRDCNENAQCLYDSHSQRYMCRCLDGYEGDGRECTLAQDAPCNVVNNCDANADCAYDAYGQRHRCQCRDGFKGDGHTCEATEIGCNILYNCGDNSECAYDHQASGYRCRCRQGFEGDGFFCRASTSCQTDPGLCHTHAQCLPDDLSNFGFSCRCLEGYTGDGIDCQEAPRHKSGIMFLNQGLSVLSMPVRSGPGYPIHVNPDMIAVGADVDCLKGRYYWTDVGSHSIRSSLYSGNEVQNVVTREGAGSVEDVAVDWISGNVYWTDSLHDVVGVVSLETSLRKTVVKDDLVNPRGIAVHPGRGLLFWSDWNRQSPKLETSGLDGSRRRVLASDGVLLPNSLVIDYETQTLCWADAGTHRIECIGIQGGGRRVVAEGAKYPFGLTIYGESFFYTDWNDTKIHEVNKYSGHETSVRRPPPGGSGKLYGIVVVPDSCPPVSNVCAHTYGGCPESHLCLPNGRGGRTCSCPDPPKGTAEEDIECRDFIN